MLITLSRCAAICQSVAQVQLTGVAPLETVSHRFIFFFIIRNKAVRFICGVPSTRIAYCNSLFSNLGNLNLPSIFILDCLLYVEKNIDSVITCSSMHDYSTHVRTDTYINKSKFSTAMNSFILVFTNYTIYLCISEICLSWGNVLASRSKFRGFKHG